MVRNLSPVLRRELANLDKDADSRKIAMQALKSYVKDLDSKTIPLFLAQVSETKEIGSVSGEYTISLYEVLARVHGVNIVPHIDSIMATIVKTLASSGSSFPLQQACSKVVPAIARYGIEPTTPDNKKRNVIHALCKPLSEYLLGSQESLTSGAALCLKALVDSDNWRFASDEIINRVCQNVAVALEEKHTQTNSHMELVMSLAKHNALIVEAYARLLIQSGMRILHAGIADGNSQKRLHAIRMVNFLMKCLDPRSIYSELDLIIDEMQKCESDQMAFVRGAAFEALETARKIVSEKKLKFEKELSSGTGSNFGRRHHSQQRNGWGSGDRSPASASPESQTVDSVVGYDSLFGSPISSRLGSPDLAYERRSMNRKLWRLQDGVVDVSLKDGLFTELVHRNGSYGNSACFKDHELDEGGGNHTDEFSGFVQRGPINGEAAGSLAFTPQSSPSKVDFDNIKIFTTPRKLIHSLQDSSETDSGSTEENSMASRSPSSSKNEWNQPGTYNSPCVGSSEVKAHENFYPGVEKFQGGSESVSSTRGGVSAAAHSFSSHEIIQEGRSPSQMYNIKKTQKKSLLAMISGLLLVFLAFSLSLFLNDDKFEVGHLVPT